METGVVKWYNDAKRYGFIVSYKDNTQLLVEQHNLVDVPAIFELQQVEFERVNNTAVNVKVLSSIVEHKLLEFPRISVFDNVLPLDYCQRLIKKHEEAGMNQDSGYQSRVESYAQVTEYVEQRSISLGVDPSDYDILATAILNVAKVPYNQIEAIDVYNYEVGRYLAFHHDYPYDPKKINYYKHGGDRVGTGIFYLNDDFVGGHTWFPKHHVNVVPKAGSFLYFEQGYDEATNWSTIHESKIIKSGTKWIASCFFSDRPRVGYSARSELDELYAKKNR
jgi:cold shock CspA family protein